MTLIGRHFRGKSYIRLRGQAAYRPRFPATPNIQALRSGTTSGYVSQYATHHSPILSLLIIQQWEDEDVLAEGISRLAVVIRKMLDEDHGATTMTSATPGTAKDFW